MGTESQALAIVGRNETSIVRTPLLEPNSLGELQQLGTLMAQSGFFSDARQAAQACVKIMAGREMGFPPIASMVGISIIEGKPAIGANLIAAAMKRAGYTWRVIQRDASGCKIVVHFRGQELGPSEFLAEDAKRAGLLNKKNWERFPRSMYFARTITDAARTYAPEVMAGMPAYTAEELGAENTTEDGSPLAQQNTPEQQAEVAERRIAEERAKAQQQKPAPPPDPKTEAVKRRAQPADQPPAPLTDEEAMERRFIHGDRFTRLQIFGDFKKRLVKTTGSEEAGHDVYYDILGRFEVGKADEFKGVKTAFECAKVMLREVLEREAAAPPPPGKFEASDDDLPQGLFPDGAKDSTYAE